MNNRMINLFLGMVVFFSIIFYSGIIADDPPAHKYVGTEMCGICHSKKDVGHQLKI